MNKKIIILVLLFSAAVSYSQSNDNTMGFGASVGFTEKVQLHFWLSDRSQLSLELGDFVYDSSENVRLGNIGSTFKYYFSSSDLTAYTGISGSYIKTNDDYLHFMIPLGLQKYATKSLALFAGLNPGVFFPLGGDPSFLLTVEFGASFYF